MTLTQQTQTFAGVDIAIDHRSDGSLILQSRQPLDTWETSIIDVLRARAAVHPDRPLAAERDERDQWRPLSYGEASAKADALGQAFLELGLGPGSPVMILSSNSVAHLLVSLGAYAAGVPVMPISVAYSVMSSDHARVKAIAELCGWTTCFRRPRGPRWSGLAAR